MPVRETFVSRVLSRFVEWVGVRTVALEVTQECNQKCLFCYNVWKCGDYPAEELNTCTTIDLIDRIIRGYRPQVLSFTGGEPLLRPDLPELIRHASKSAHCNLISNGTLMSDDLARELIDSGVRVFEFTLLSADREIHNKLVGRDSFDEVIEAIASVRAAGGTVATTFVATRANIHTWGDTLELCACLGVSGILFNRFNFGGAGVRDAANLTPSAHALREALDIAEEGSGGFGISISCGVPAPPCIVNRDRYQRIHFSDCPMGTRRAYPTVDASGNVRPCNHSPKILGNLFEKSFSEILSAQEYRACASNVAAECMGCKHLRSCRGGCRAAAEIAGEPCGIDPFVPLAMEEEVQQCLI